jgi:hypothetical protein
MTVINVEASSSRDFKAYSTSFVLRDYQSVKFFYTHAIRVPTMRATLLTPLTPMFNDFITLLSVPNFRLTAATSLARRMPTLCPLLMNTEGIKRFACAADITNLHRRSANPPYFDA